MMRERSISFRKRDRGMGFASKIRPIPLTAITDHPEITLLIHGFNNSRPEAEAHYAAFIRQLGHSKTPFVKVFWPGDGGITGYPLSIRAAKDTALLLASELRRAADIRRSTLRVNVVAHSMGCRLTLELLHELENPPHPLLEVSRIVLMAAAVPVIALASSKAASRSLGDTLRAGKTRVLSLYSPADLVLKHTFPAGQRMADCEGIDHSGPVPRALGVMPWLPDPLDVPMPRLRLLQMHTHKANHGHYWPNRWGNVAPRIRRFFRPLGYSQPRQTPKRSAGLRTFTEKLRVVWGRRIHFR